MVKTRQIRRCQGLDKLVKHVAAMQNPPLMLFLIDCVSKNDSFVSEQDLSICQKT